MDERKPKLSKVGQKIFDSATKAVKKCSEDPFKKRFEA